MKLLGFCLAAASIFAFSCEIWAQQNLLMSDAARTNAIPFQLEGGFLIEVEGRIGQLEGLKFILDTGATHSVIDRRIADRLSRHSVQEESSTSITSSESTGRNSQMCNLGRSRCEMCQ